MNTFSRIALVVFFTVSSALAANLVGQPAPNFTAKNQDGKDIRLADLKGKYVVLYFYPKDDTPGCTKQACKFRDESSKIKKLNTVVLGVSRQDAKSHQEFREKHHLPFDLLLDTDGALGKQFGIDSIPIVGFHKRQMVLIGPDGRVLQFYDKVDPEKNVDEVMAAIEADEKKVSPSASPMPFGNSKS